MQHIEKCTYVYVVHVFEVDYICRPQIPQQRYPESVSTTQIQLGPVYMEVEDPG